MKIRNVLNPTILVAFFALLAGQAAAQEIVTIWPGGTAEINRHGICRRVHNGSGTTLAVPTRSAAEWSNGGNAFLNNMAGMPGVSAYACPPPRITLYGVRPIQWTWDDFEAAYAGDLMGGNVWLGNYWGYMFGGLYADGMEHPHVGADIRSRYPGCESYYIEFEGRGFSHFIDAFADYRARHSGWYGDTLYYNFWTQWGHTGKWVVTMAENQYRCYVYERWFQNNPRQPTYFSVTALYQRP